MSDQLFDGVTPAFDLAGMVRRNDVDMSIMSAKVVDIHCRETDRVIVLRLLHEAGERGLTDHCLAHLMGKGQTSVGKRRGEAVADGLVVRRQVIDPKTLRLVDDHRIPIAGSRQRCAVWVTVGHQRSNT